jgi:hypothetical protein
VSQAFYSVSAPAGSGKTYALINYAIDLAKNGQKVLIAQPSKPLIDQTHRDLLAKNSGVPITKLISTDGVRATAPVLAKVVKHMQTAQSGQGEVLLISQVTLGRLPTAFRREWHLFVDEVPGAFKAHDMNMNKTHAFITAHTKVERLLIDDILIVDPENETALRQLAENPTGDKALATFCDLASDILNEDKFVCVSKSEYDELLTPGSKRKTVFFYSFQRSEFVTGYQSVTMMGANFEDTELYRLWEKLDNIEWKKHPILNANLRYQKHTNGTRLTLKYLIKGNWSQYFAGQAFGDGTILSAMAQTIEAELGQDFLWQANKKFGDFIFEYGERLPIVTHGLNRASYQAKHGVALVRAINHSSGPAAFLKAIGFTAEELKVTLQYQNEYQAMMRCSLRDPNATDDVTVFVVSEASAVWIEQHFPGCKVEQHQSDIPEPRPSGQPVEEPMAPAERVWNSREKRKLRIADAEGRAYEVRPWPGKK